MSQIVFEVEAKIALADPQELLSCLRQLGAIDHGQSVQVDTYFSHPQRNFASTDEALRLRQVNDTFELTYKGPRQGSGDIKARLEENVPVGRDPRVLLQAIGFEPSATVRKTRWAWSFADTQVVIDEVDGLGNFVEVEATGTSEESSRQLVAEAVAKLGLDLGDARSLSYLEMLQAK